jgi:hypothetical protein
MANDDYHHLQARILTSLAHSTINPGMAAELMRLANEYWALSNQNGPTQRQQQIQPKVGDAGLNPRARLGFPAQIGAY